MTEIQIQIDHRVQSPVGTITLAVRGESLCALDFMDESAMRDRLERRFGAVRFVDADDPAGHTGRLRAYFGGQLDALDDIEVDAGGTDFQRRVWRALRDVGVGETRSYKEIAEVVGKPGASRAVGMANHRNPVALVIPCHRVVNADRKLGGYAGGLDAKLWLLEHEGALLDYSSRNLTL
jgi:methylated-DNA-[protein]-cysteine S-methyltransferase